LQEAADALEGQSVATAELTRVVGRAYLMARRLEPTREQLACRDNAKLEETISSLLLNVGASDEELIGLMRRGLGMMARGIACRADEWASRDVEIGARLVGVALGTFIDEQQARRAS
jgi:hypothetical protein